jgi:serine/threonine protein kinase
MTDPESDLPHTSAHWRSLKGFGQEAVMQSNAIIASSFRLLHEVGSDAVTRTFRAQTLDTEEFVAVKLMHGDLSADASRVSGFLEACEAARGIVHANVAHIVACGVDRVPYVAYAWANGQTLDRVMTLRKIEVELACEIGLHLLAALAAANEHGVQHLHLSPREVIVDFENPLGPRTQVFDFGLIERSLGSDAPRSAYEKHYLAPELLAGTPGDMRSDIHGVGMILYELLSRANHRRPQEQWTRPSHDLAELVAVNPSVPEPLLRTIACAIDGAPSARIGSASEFARLLVPYVRPKLRSNQVAHLNTLDPVLRDFESIEVSPSIQIARAPKPRTDSACPEEMLLEPTFPRSPTAPRLEALHADAYGKRRAPAAVELETVEYAAAEPPAEPAPAQDLHGGRTAMLAIGAGLSVGAALAWLGTII